MKIALINENSQAAKNALICETLKKVVETGKHEELLERNGRYAELYHMQFKDVLK